jgi:hypothetical protein
MESCREGNNMPKSKTPKLSKIPSDYQWQGERALYGQTFPPYHGTNPLAKYPKIFKYLNYLSDIKINASSLKEFSDKDKKSLLLIGGTEEIQYGVLWYVWDELRHIIPSEHPLIVHKNILCGEKNDDDLMTEIFANWSIFSPVPTVTFVECCKSLKKEDIKTFIDDWYPEIMNAIRPSVDIEMWAYPEAISLENVRKSFNANCKYVQNKMERKEYLHEDEIIRDILDIYNHLPRFDILSLSSIASINNDVWIELTASHMSHTSRWKPDLITASLKQGETIAQFPDAFINMFEVIDLSEPDKVACIEAKQKEGDVINTENENVFRKDSERWYIKFENEVLSPENLDGFGFIHYLMQYDKKIKPKKLYQAVKGVKTLNKEEDDSLKTYTVQTKIIEKAQHGELKEYHRNDQMIQFKNELTKMDKNTIKKIVGILKKDKETLINRKSELEEEGVSSRSDDIKKEIKDVQKKIDLATRKEHNPEHKQFYDLVSKAIAKAKERIKTLSDKEDYSALLTWTHFEDSIVYNDFHYSYKPTVSINWKL